MREIKIDGPICIGCQKRITRPSQADMALYRVGLHVHTNCIKIWERIEYAVKRKTR